MKECISDIYYDYIIVAATPFSEIEKRINEDLKDLNVDKKRIFPIGAIYMEYFYSFIHMFSYIQKNVSLYKILITGISYTWRGTDINCYELPVLNCTITSQDLYYDYLFAEKIFNMKNSKFKYAVIGMAPYSFHYDESKGGV